MAYKDRYGSTDIRNGKIYNLSIGWDSDKNPENEKERYPVILFTPDMDDTMTHYHVQLSKKEARILAKWLQDYLSNGKTKWKK